MHIDDMTDVSKIARRYRDHKEVADFLTNKLATEDVDMFYVGSNESHHSMTEYVGKHDLLAIMRWIQVGAIKARRKAEAELAQLGVTV